ADVARRHLVVFAERGDDPPFGYPEPEGLRIALGERLGHELGHDVEPVGQEGGECETGPPRGRGGSRRIRRYRFHLLQVVASCRSPVGPGHLHTIQRSPAASLRSPKDLMDLIEYPRWRCLQRSATPEKRETRRARRRTGAGRPPGTGRAGAGPPGGGS